MAQVIADRMTARIDGDFVVFMIGLRINKPWKIAKWLPAILAMPRMVKELEALPADQTGFLGHTGLRPGLIVQYWRSFDHLEAYARARDHRHFPVWTAFNERMKNSRGDLGIWHETYLIPDGQYETIYSGMPAFGLGRAAQLVPVAGHRDTARSRLTD